MHSDILNYTKLAFNGLKMIQNDTVYLSANQTGADRALINVEYLGSLLDQYVAILFKVTFFMLATVIKVVLFWKLSAQGTNCDAIVVLIM